MEAENIVDKKELKGLPIWACILLFIVVFFVFMLLYSALIQGFLSLVLGVEARHPGIVGYILQEMGMFLAALTSAVIMLRFERRPFSDLGLSVKGHARGLWYGLLIAVLFYLVGFGLSLLLGEIEVTGFKFESVNLLGSWVFFLLVALFEEILMRGYILGRLLHTRMNKFLSIYIISIVCLVTYLQSGNRFLAYAQSATCWHAAGSFLLVYKESLFPYLPSSFLELDSGTGVGLRSEW